MSLAIALRSSGISSLPKRKLNVSKGRTVNFMPLSLINYCRILTHTTIKEHDIFLEK
jgi:hypothetical protein